MHQSVYKWRAATTVCLLLVSGFPLLSPGVVHGPLSSMAQVSASSRSQAIRPASLSPLAARSLLARYGQMPLRFEINRGQTASSVRYLARGAGYTLFLTGTQAVLALAAPSSTTPSGCTNPSMRGGSEQGATARGTTAARTLESASSADVAGPHAAHARSHAAGVAPFDSASASGSCPPSAAAATDGQQAGSVLKLDFLGAAAHPAVAGQDLLPGGSNYMTGRTAHTWLRAVPSYARVVYHNLYPGVDLAYHGQQSGQVEYDLHVAPGADLSRIKLSVQGAGALRLDRSGNLVVPEAGKVQLQERPVVYQQTARGRHAVTGRYVLYGGGAVGFAVGRYDHALPLVIDPVLVYSTYLGGSGGGGGGDSAARIAADGSGDVFVTGMAYSPNFPTTTGAYSVTLVNTYRNSPNAFVSELSADGSRLIYSTYLGGSGGIYGAGDNGSGIALAYGCMSGCAAYVTGYTYSPDFPTTTGAFSRTLAATNTADLFVAKLSGDGGSLLYGSYLGGSKQNFDYNYNNFNVNNSIAVDVAGRAFVAGTTYSSDFPTTTNALSPTMTNTQKGSEAFLSEFDPSISGAGSLVYSTYLGGSGGRTCLSQYNCYYNDSSFGVAVDAAGHPFVAGYVSSKDFPTTTNAYARRSSNSLVNAFVSEFDTTQAGTASLLYSTYLGGNSFDYATGIATDPSGRAYLTGYTNSYSFPTTTNAYSRTIGSTNGNAFISKIDTAISGTGSLVYSSFLGGSGGFRTSSTTVIGDGANAIAVDGSGRAYVIGGAYSRDFPTTANAFARTPSHASSAYSAANVFVSVVDTTISGANGLVYSAYLEGSTNDSGAGIAIAVGCVTQCLAYVAGRTYSTDFPTTANALSRTLGSFNGIAFVSALDPSMSGAASLRYSTYLGGSGGTYGGDSGSSITVDASGHAYIVGSTRSATFPTTTGAYATTSGGYGASDAFVTELSSDGSALVYSTYLGGSGYSSPTGIALRPGCVSACNAYIVGSTSSPNFPATSNVVGGTLPMTASHAFLSELSGDGGSLLYSTLLGGGSSDSAGGVAVDTTGRAYLAGTTRSGDFPTTTNAYSRTLGTAAGGNAFVAEIDPSIAGTNGLLYSTFLGGSGTVHYFSTFSYMTGDYASGLALDPGGRVFVTGEADSADFPTTTNAYSRTVGTTDGNAFVSELDLTKAGPASLLYSTFLGGSKFVYGTSIATDAAGHAFITGETDAADFPTTTNAYSRTIGTTGGNAFMSEFDTTISGTGSLLYSTFLGGSAFDYGQGIAVDPAGRAFITGEAASSDFPTTTNAYSRTLSSFSNAFVSELDPTIAGTAGLVYSTFLGGSSFDYGQGIAVDPMDNVYVTGKAGSSDFPTTAGAYQRTLRAPFGNAFVARLNLSTAPLPTPTVPASATSAPVSTITTAPAATATAPASTATTAPTATPTATPTAATTSAPAATATTAVSTARATSTTGAQAASTATTTSMQVSTSTTVPAKIDAPKSTATSVSVVSPAPSQTPSPTTHPAANCALSLLLHMNPDLPPARGYMHGRPVAVVHGLTNAHQRVVSLTPLFVDGQGFLLFSSRTYEALSCGRSTQGLVSMQVTGAAAYGIILLHGRGRTGTGRSLKGDTFIVTVTQTRQGIHKTHGRDVLSAYRLHVHIPAIGYDRTFDGLIGPFVLTRSTTSAS